MIALFELIVLVVGIAIFAGLTLAVTVAAIAGPLIGDHPLGRLKL